VKPAPARATGYPRLARAWRLLVGAAPLVMAPAAARGDASTPPCPQHANQNSGKVPQAKGDIPAPKPPAPPPVDKAKAAEIILETPALGGVIAAPEPPRPPSAPPPQPKVGEPKKAAPPPKGKTIVPPKKQEPVLDGLLGRRVAPPDGRAVAFVVGGEPREGAIVIHPHGPDEPCRRRG